MDKDLIARQQARELAQKAKAAAAVLAKFSQQQIDAVIDAAAQAVDREAENLARLAVEETTYGNVPDKIQKNRFSSRNVYEYVRSLKTAGIIREDPDRKVIEIAEPVGVVAAILPSTNPTSTAIYKILISLKARNSIVLSPHPSAKRCICRTAEIMSQAAIAAGAPDGAICCMTEVSNEGTHELMQSRNVNVILATGGSGIVRLAYSSGKPAFGVGPGNVPAFIERSANIPKAVKDIITGKTFDNGVLCSSEQAIVCEESIKDQVIRELRNLKIYFLNDEQIQAVGRIVITPAFGVNPKIVGKRADYIASLAGIQVPPETPALLAPLKGVGKEYPLSLEKLSPVLAFYTVPDYNSGIELCQKLLSFGGMGHTMSFHSTNQQLIVETGLRIPVFRIIINSPATHGSVGLSTGLVPAMTLGCGSPGNNITSDNISPLHLINIKRVAMELREVQPTTRSGDQHIHTQPQQIARKVPDGSLYTRIESFLNQKGLQTAPAPEPPRQIPPAPPAPEPSVKFGEHKIYPVSSSVIPNPALYPVQSGNPHNSPPSAPVDFVCEDDVKQALAKNQTITIHARTIVTPAAQDLASNKNVLKRV